MHIYVLSKQDFFSTMIVRGIKDLTVESFDKNAFISINNSNVEFIDPPFFKKQHSNALTLFFDDVTDDSDPILEMFSDKEAKRIIEFFSDNRDKESLIIHCSAGISRSGAVGLFLNDLLNQDYYEFMRINPKVKPNPLVLKILKQEYGN